MVTRLAERGISVTGVTKIEATFDLNLDMVSGDVAQNAFGDTLSAVDRGTVRQTILAIGIQDIDPSGLKAPVTPRMAKL